MNYLKSDCPIRVLRYSKSDSVPLCGYNTCTHILLPGETVCPCHNKPEPLQTEEKGFTEPCDHPEGYCKDGYDICSMCGQKVRGDGKICTTEITLAAPKNQEPEGMEERFDKFWQGLEVMKELHKSYDGEALTKYFIINEISLAERRAYEKIIVAVDDAFERNSYLNLENWKALKSHLTKYL